jgi:hypothetical protein
MGLIIFLALVAAAGYAAFHVGPVYFDHYDFVDKVNEICRTPRYKARTDQMVIDMLMAEVRKRQLYDWIGPESFQVITTETNRRIRLYYEREALILPGWKRLFKFDFTADQPLV